MIRKALWILPLLLLLLAGPALAQDTITDDEVNEVAKEIYCPVCESTPLDVCPTAACADWRELIRTQLSEGATKQDVMTYFARQYGDGVLANPPRQGLNLIVLWVLPVLLVVLGGLLFFRLLRGMRRDTAGAAPPVPPAKPGAVPPVAPAAGRAGGDLDDYVARVERELGNN